jgi:putative transposase
MMGKYYQTRTNRSKRKLHNLDGNAVTVEVAGGKACFQIVLPFSEALFDVAKSIEQTASEAGLLLMKSFIDEEVKQLAGSRYLHDSNRRAVRWGQDEGHVIFSGRKVAMKKPRVRSADGSEELELRRWNAFAHPARMRQSIADRILRRVSCRDYAGTIDDICDGYGIDKSSVSRQWQAASVEQLKALCERRLEGLDICVLLLDGKEFQEHTLITALGMDAQGYKHVLGLWPGATENSVICGALLDNLIERGLSVNKKYLFIIDGSKALRKAVVERFGTTALIQRCRIHKERNIRSYLPKKHHRLLAMKLRAAFGMTDYDEALEELGKVHQWLMTISEAAANSLQEGFEELLTVHKLKLSALHKRLLGNTNMIESCLSIVNDLCRNVKNWQNENMVVRWAGSVLLEAEKRLYRIKGHREMPMLVEALNGNVDSKEAVA